ncbi:MAG: hypothetical protein V3V99_03810 [candidate division Zixibacteria bacterium]
MNVKNPNQFNESNVNRNVKSSIDNELLNDKSILEDRLDCTPDKEANNRPIQTTIPQNREIIEFEKHVDRCLSMILHYKEVRIIAKVIKEIHQKQLKEE